MGARQGSRVNTLPPSAGTLGRVVQTRYREHTHTHTRTHTHPQGTRARERVQHPPWRGDYERENRDPGACLVTQYCVPPASLSLSPTLCDCVFFFLSFGSFSFSFARRCFSRRRNKTAEPAETKKKEQKRGKRGKCGSQPSSFAASHITEGPV